MIKKRIIPKLLFRTNNNLSKVITTQNFILEKETGEPISQSKIYEAQNADELIFIDLNASTYKTTINLELINAISQEIFMPITVGGGINNLTKIKELLHNGADKICLNTSAYNNINIVKDAVQVFGSQCIVACIDYKYNIQIGDYILYIERGKVNTGTEVLKWAEALQNAGAGEILLSSIDKDGTSEGLDINLIKNVSENIDIPLIASGGCGIASHFIEGFLCDVDAIAAGTFFSYKDQNPLQTRAQIKNSGINLR